MILLLRQFLNNYRGNLRAQAAANEATPATAGPAAVVTAPNPDGNNNGAEDEEGSEEEDESDVMVSDIGD